MRLVCLNIWRGKLLEELVGFIKREAKATDIFCFQEMINSLGSSSKETDVFSVFAKALPGFQGFFEAAQDEGRGIEMGLATFIKRTDAVDKEGDFFVYRTRNAMLDHDGRTLGRNVQFIQFPKSGKEFTVVNFHGLWTGESREDSKDRIAQSRKLKEFLTTIGGTRIVCGDFNLGPDTRSMAIIEQGMKNLIKERGITSTRSSFFPYPDKFCDYILVDKDVTVNDFRVLSDEVSDHLALVLDFD